MAVDLFSPRARASGSVVDLAPDVLAALERMAAKYIWWKTPDEAVSMPWRVIAQVMDIGDYGDVQTLAGLVGDGGMLEVLTQAEPGEFSERSWAYWHYRLGSGSLDNMPSRPSRILP